MAKGPQEAARTPRKTVLLRASAELFAARGFRAVSIDEIGHAAGISGPGVYRHFSTKTDILLQLCHEAMDSLLDGALGIVEEGCRGVTRVEALVELHVDFAVRERASQAVYLREQMELPARELRVLRARQRDYEKLWVDALRAVSDLPLAQTRAAVKLLLSMLNGTAHIRDAVPRAQLVEMLTRMAAGALREMGVPVGTEPELPVGWGLPAS